MNAPGSAGPAPWLGQAGFIGLQRRHSRLLGLAVLALHAVVAALLWHMRWTAAPTPAAEPRPLMLRLLWPSEPAPPSADGRPKVQRPGRPAPAAPSAAAPAPAPPPTAADNSAAITLPAVAAAPPDDAASRPLDLQYHGGTGATSPSLVGQALNDPRANFRTSHADTGRSEERMAEGYRVRSGGHCYRIHDSRAASLDPIGQSTSPKPRGVESCD